MRTFPVPRAMLAAALLACAAAVVPAPARAQTDLTVCADQPVPEGYVVVAAGKGDQCPGYYASGPNVLTLRVPGDEVSVCNAYTTSLPGYAVVAAGKGDQCPGYYASGPNLLTWRVPGGEVVVCSAYTPSLPGYAVVAAGKGDQCPGYYANDPNILTLRVPGDEVTVCSAYTTSLPGYVVTAREKRDACPGYYASGPNSATYRRLAQTAPPPPPAEDGAVMEALDEHGAYVQRRLRVAEARLRAGDPTHLPWTDAMASGATARVELFLEQGAEYTLVAVCDADCSAISIRLVAPSGVVAAVSEPGTQSVVRLTPAERGRWTLEASVRQCAADFCRFAVGAYQPAAPDGASQPRRPSTRQ